MIDLSLRRRFFAEELEAVCRLQSASLVDAFAAVPRERFLPPGPWTIMAEVDFAGGQLKTRTTPDADPARITHNIGVAIDPARALFTGQPGTIAVWLDAASLSPGGRVLHIGCGLGYYTAVIAHCVGPDGRVVAIEIDHALASAARQNLSDLPSVEVRQGDGYARLDASFDAIIVNAGVTHPLDVWLDALAIGGRMILPLTSMAVPMGGTIGKGLVVLISREGEEQYSARVMSFVAIYSALDIRDPAGDAPLGKALMGGPARWASLARLRRDPHEPAATCWLHGSTCCWSTE